MGVVIQVNNGEWACFSKKNPPFENSRSATALANCSTTLCLSGMIMNRTRARGAHHGPRANAGGAIAPYKVQV
jgi:hypothetical protein